MYINGDLNSESSRLLEFQLIKCHDRVDCKSDEEIIEFIRGKWLLILFNQKRFDS